MMNANDVITKVLKTAFEVTVELSEDIVALLNRHYANEQKHAKIPEVKFAPMAKRAFNKIAEALTACLRDYGIKVDRKPKQRTLCFASAA